MCVVHCSYCGLLGNSDVNPTPSYLQLDPLSPGLVPIWQVEKQVRGVCL